MKYLPNTFKRSDLIFYVVSEQKDTSLEEISLKIISSFIREKMELEQQCDQVRIQDFTHRRAYFNN